MSTQSQDPLFDEFTPPTRDAWAEAAVASLKGKPLERVAGRTADGIPLALLYWPDDAADLPHLPALPGDFPYVRGTRPDGYLQQPWLVAQELAAGTPQQANEVLRRELARGQTAVNLIPDRPTRDGVDPDARKAGDVGRGGVSLAAAADLAALLDGVDLAATPLFLRAGTAALPLGALLLAAVEAQGGDPAALRGSLEGDPLGELARRGALPLPVAQAFDELATLLRGLAQTAPQLAAVTLHGYPYANAGGAAVQELGFVLAAAVDTIRALHARGVSIDAIGGSMRVALSIGGDFFAEIAKFRAARMVWAQMMRAFGAGEAAQKLTLHGRSARWNKSVTDPTVNLLRGTTEALAGALGGADSLHVAPFDEETGPSDPFSRRIARNVQIILQEEAGLARLVDPAGGAAFVEWLTDEVARRAWELFQEVEQQGGMLAALHAGWVQAQLAETAARRAADLAARREVLVGTNQYANLEETAAAVDETDYAALYRDRVAAVAEIRKRDVEMPAAGVDLAGLVRAAGAGATLGQLTAALRPQDAAPLPAVQPVGWHRAAQPFEQLRANADAYRAAHGRRLRVFLATMGPLRQHKARADFARGFFEVGGFEVVYPDGFDTPEAAAAAARASAAAGVVLCSTDETYPALVPPFVAAMRLDGIEMAVILAGNPGAQAAAYRAAGVDAFIHLGADCLALNQWLQARVMPLQQMAAS